jgi:hypothetical protein
MNTTEQRICAWGGFAFVFFFGIGMFALAQFLPPHSPSASAADIAAIYQQNPLRIRAGLALALFGSAFVVPFCAVVSAQMRRIPGSGSVLANTQMLCGAVGILMVFTIPLMVWETVAFRPDRAPDIMLAMNDFAWMMFAMTLSPAFVQLVAIALSIFLDSSAEPIFPRWVAYFNLWVAILVLPAGVIAMFHTGPFAWDGLIAFWLPVAVFSAWVLRMSFLLLAMIKKQEVSERQ